MTGDWLFHQHFKEIVRQLKNNNLYSRKHSSLFQSEVTICAQDCFKLVLIIVEIELPINLRVANKNNKMFDVITCRCLRKIKGQSNSVQISGI
jgi:hypothetical protein